MILIDFNQVAISNFYQNMKSVKEGDEVQPDLLKHMILNSLRMLAAKYKQEYGEVVLACDSNSWRKEYFPYYKHKRYEKKKSDKVNWDRVYNIINELLGDIEENFPYKVIRVNGAEGDDVIGTLVQHYYTYEKIMIISSDRDFVQLQKYPNVRQYSPTQKEEVTTENPLRDLKQKIIYGQDKDGIPNFRSSDDVFATDARQKPIRKDKLEEWLDKPIWEIQREEKDGDQIKQFWDRNRKLIDLDYIPEKVQEEIIDRYNRPTNNDKNALMSYLQSQGYKNLLKQIEDF